jgi:16S rRNA (cytosine967-C5)-methyltransferase
MRVTPARRIAYEILYRVEAEGAYASDLLHARLDAGVKTEDAGLATELTLGVLRWRRLIDFLLQQQLKKPVAKLDAAVAIALRMGTYQLRFLERVPPPAAVNESVELVKRARKSSAATLVNAVLRRVAASAKADLDMIALRDSPPAERLAVIHSHPTWMTERWIGRLGEARAIELLEADNRTPLLSCATEDPARREEAIENLKRSGLRIKPGRLLKNAFSVSGGSLTRTAAFQKGWISIQDEASQAIPLLLEARAGERVLDLCAAPGGKTAALVRAVGSEGAVVAADRYAHRLRAMREQFTRQGLERAAMVELDAAQPLPFRFEFRRILVDAPCSGTGTLARHPEIRWRLQPEQLREFQALQVSLVRSALAHLAPGGRLVYSTCSLEPEENEEVVAEVLALFPAMHVVKPGISARALAPHLATGVDPAGFFAAGDYFRTLPAMHDADGFFAAVLERN